MSDFARHLAASACLGATLAVVASGGPAVAQGFPERPITIVVPFSPGGSSDLLGRTVAEQLSKQSGASFVVENKPGASGAVGTAEVAQSAPDGHTLIQVTAGTIALTPAMSPSVPFDTMADFAPIAFMVSEPNGLLINPEIPATTVEEFVAWVKAQDAPVPYGSAGPGTPAHLGMELFTRAAGIEMTHVPYRGAAPAVADVVAGHVKAVFPTMASAISQVDSGAVRVLAVTSPERVEKLPDVPTVFELGMPEMAVPIWYGYFAPAGTPDEALTWLHDQFTQALADPEFTALLESFGQTPWSPDQKLEDAAAFVEETIDQAQEIVETTGIRLEN